MASAIHQHESPIGIHVTPPSWTPLLPPCPSHPPRWSWNTSSGFFVSYTKLPLALDFTYGNVHVSILFSQTIPPSPSPTVSKRLFFMSVVHTHNEILLSSKKECIWVSSNEVDEHRAYFTKWSKSEREKQISYTNSYIFNLEMVLMNLFAEQRWRHRH